MRSPLKLTLLVILILFILPLVARASWYAFDDRPRRWSEADWSSVGFLPPPQTDRQARVLVLAGRTGGWKGLFAVHCWIVLKPENAGSWTRYDVVGWGNPIRINGWAPDGRWFGDPPRVIADVRGEAAAALIPKIQRAIAEYPYKNRGDYRMWPGPNSNTFVAAILREAPELGAALPPEAVGRDFQAGLSAGLTASRTGFEANLCGVLGFRLAMVEGLEVNFLGLVAGVRIYPPAIKLPGFGQIGLLSGGATASAAVAK